jgi:hypothetical protein
MPLVTSIICPFSVLEYLPYLMPYPAFWLASPQNSVRIFGALEIE